MDTMSAPAHVSPGHLAAPNPHTNPRGNTMNTTQTKPATVLVYRPGFGWVERPAA
jgi:hypothetical protein